MKKVIRKTWKANRNEWVISSPSFGKRPVSRTLPNPAGGGYGNVQDFRLVKREYVKKFGNTFGSKITIISYNKNGTSSENIKYKGGATAQNWDSNDNHRSITETFVDGFVPMQLNKILDKGGLCIDADYYGGKNCEVFNNYNPYLTPTPIPQFIDGEKVFDGDYVCLQFTPGDSDKMPFYTVSWDLPGILDFYEDTSLAEKIQLQFKYEFQTSYSDSSLRLISSGCSYNTIFEPIPVQLRICLTDEDGGRLNEQGNVTDAEHKILWFYSNPSIITETPGENSVNIEVTSDCTLSLCQDDDQFSDDDPTPTPTLTPTPTPTPISAAAVNFVPTTKSELQTATDAWIADESSALTTYGDINTWDVSNVTDMSNLFRKLEQVVVGTQTMTIYAKYDFNSDISNWDTSNVTNMRGMFSNAILFDQDISNWNTSKVTNMSKMFSDCNNFNKNISAWDTSKVTNMSRMFERAHSFNQPIGSWNTSNVTDMQGMFSYAYDFNQNINDWDTSKVTNMRQMFSHPPFGAPLPSFNSDISSWNTSNVTNMDSMFYSCRSFNQDISVWNTGNVTNMKNMFNGALTFNSDISLWNVSSVTNMDSMFWYTPAFDQDLTNWCVDYFDSEPTQFGGTGSWTSRPVWGTCPEVSQFSDDDPTPTPTPIPTPTPLPAPVAVPTFSLSATSSDGFDNSGTPLVIEGNSVTITLTTTNVPEGTLVAWTTNHTSYLSISGGDFPAIGADGKSSMVISTVERPGENPFDTGNTSILLIFSTFGEEVIFASSIRTFFKIIQREYTPTPTPTPTPIPGPTIFTPTVKAELKNIADLWVVNQEAALQSGFGDINTWDVSNITDMSDLFKGAEISSLDISNWDVSNVTNMEGMFDGAEMSSLDLSNWDVSNVTNMKEMFYTSEMSSLNLSNWNTGNVTNMKSMFGVMINLESLDVSSFDTSSVLNMEKMFNFHGNQVLNKIDGLLSFDTSQVTNMKQMFGYAEKITDLTEISGWSYENVQNMDYMLDYTQSLSTESYDAILNGWAGNQVNPSVPTQSKQRTGAKYSSASQDARDFLTQSFYGWTITDGGMELLKFYHHVADGLGYTYPYTDTQLRYVLGKTVSYSTQLPVTNLSHEMMLENGNGGYIPSVYSDVTLSAYEDHETDVTYWEVEELNAGDYAIVKRDNLLSTTLSADGDNIWKLNLVFSRDGYETRTFPLWIIVSN